MTEFGKRIKAARRLREMTQAALAERLGLKQSTIASTELRNESSSYTAQIAEALEVNANWLATGNGEMLGADSCDSHAPSSQQECGRGSDDDRAFDAVIWLADRIKDKRRREAALARCVGIMNQALLDELTPTADERDVGARSMALSTPQATQQLVRAG